MPVPQKVILGVSHFANILLGAKHFGSKSLIITNKFSAEMLRPFQIEMYPADVCT